MDTTWVFICGFLVLSMQLGFAILEVGAVRAKNAVNIFMKNFLYVILSVFAWWALGFPLEATGSLLWQPLLFEAGKTGERMS